MKTDIFISYSLLNPQPGNTLSIYQHYDTIECLAFFKQTR